MRGLGLFFGRASRNDPIKLADPHPVTNYGDDQHTGKPALDGYTLLSRASRTAQGSSPLVDGALGQAYQGPDQSFEQ